MVFLWFTNNYYLLVADVSYEDRRFFFKENNENNLKILRK